MTHLPSSSPILSLPRKRGGQPGNTNALKHGFYSPRFHKRELTDLAASSFKDLDQEIALLRTFTRRLAERRTSTSDLRDTLLLVRTLCLSSSLLTRLLKIQRLLSSTSQKEEFDGVLEETLDQVCKELGIVENWPNPGPPAFPQDPDVP